MARLSKPALLSAFVCPGMGHWAAGWRVTGAILVSLTLLSVGTPLALMVYGVGSRPFCYDDLWPCTKLMFGHAWGLTWPSLAVGLPVLALVYVGALVHAMTLDLPGEPPRQSTG